MLPTTLKNKKLFLLPQLFAGGAHLAAVAKVIVGIIKSLASVPAPALYPPLQAHSATPVSYTHLTLPTKLSV